MSFFIYTDFIWSFLIRWSESTLIHVGTYDSKSLKSYFHVHGPDRFWRH